MLYHPYSGQVTADYDTSTVGDAERAYMAMVESRLNLPPLEEPEDLKQKVEILKDHIYLDETEIEEMKSKILQMEK